MKIAVVGGGLTGLTAAYQLSQKNHQVSVFEKENYLGGLAAGFKKKNWNWSLENFFHHLFVSDTKARSLIVELGLGNKLFFSRPKTSVFYQGQVFQFDSPLSLLVFPHLTLPEKFRAGLATTSLKLTNNWRKLEKTPAHVWLKKNYGQQVYRKIWEPLLKSKFGNQANQVSMAWFWARIKKRSSRLGYLEGGFQVLINKLVEKIKENGGKIFLKHEVKNLSSLLREHQFDRVIVTIPFSTFLKITPDLPKGYAQKLRKLKMAGAINLILDLKEKFLKDNTYWLNINEPNFPFVAVVEHTNLLSSKHYKNHHLVYVGGYYSQNHPYFKMKKNQIWEEFLPYLQKINPGLKHFSRLTYHISRNLYAQPVIPINYSKIMPQIKTPISKVYLANMQTIYPWDRGINYAIELGEKVAKVVHES